MGTKAAALKVFPEKFSQDFGEGDVTDTTFYIAEKYLRLSVIQNARHLTSYGIPNIS